jgi:hypothetical protein
VLWEEKAVFCRAGGGKRYDYRERGRWRRDPGFLISCAWWLWSLIIVRCLRLSFRWLLL